MVTRPIIPRLLPKKQVIASRKAAKEPKTTDLETNPTSLLRSINADRRRFLQKQNVRAVLDLGAAPGEWSRVAAQLLSYKGPVEAPAPRTISKSISDLRLGRRGKPPHEWGEKEEEEEEERRARRSNLPKHTMSSIFDLKSLLFPSLFGYDYSEEDYGASTDARGIVVAVDVKKMVRIPGVRRIQADFMMPGADILVEAALKDAGGDGTVDIIMSDVELEPSGDRLRDVQKSLDMCRRVLWFAQRRLRVADDLNVNRGVMLLRHPSHPLLVHFKRTVLMPHFNYVKHIHRSKLPLSPQDDAKDDAYFFCRGWKGEVSHKDDIIRTWKWDSKDD